MKTTKKTTKSTKTTKTSKTKHPVLFMNFLDASTPEDVRYETIAAKVRAGLAITEDELDEYETIVITSTIELCNSISKLADTIKEAINTFAESLTKTEEKKEEKKLPWYKRLWKWLFRK